MSGKSEKKLRRERKKIIEKNRDLVMTDIIIKLKQADLKTRLGFCFIILFKKQ